MYSRDIIFKKQPCYIIIWIILFIILLFSLLFISFYKYNPYYIVTGIYDKEGNNVTFLLENNKLFYIQDAEIIVNKVIINKKDVLIGEYVYSENKIYNSLSISLDSKLNEPLVSISFKLPKTTILRKIWKGLME